VRFPVTVKHRSAKVKIYARTKNFLYYRLSYTTAGKTHRKTFKTYPLARAAAERIVRELANGSQAAALTASQSRDAIAAIERLHAYFQSTGQRTSLLGAVSEWAESKIKLNGRALGEAIEGFLSTVANVKRKDIAAAVAEFVKLDEPLTKATDGKRAQLSAKYSYNRKGRLEKFAGVFPHTAVCDLSKEHLDKFFESLGELKTKSRNKRKVGSAKSRNHYRASVRQFLQWAVRKDYLSPTHRLFEADRMRPEKANTSETKFYTPKQFTALLDKADEIMQPIIALGGLAGLRTEELRRLDWAEVWRVDGYIEITKEKSKTRQRRLVKICPALAAWLEPYRRHAGKLWNGHEITFHKKFNALCDLASVERNFNGLRHSFCSYHFALYFDENKTGAQAGHTPAMIHAHYKGLATEAEAEKWFSIMPPKSAKNVISLQSARANART